MINGSRVLGVIPARGGSKGLPGKNIRPLAGKPLIAWTIDAARGSRYIDSFILSSDDPAIIDVARRHGCEVPFVRDSTLASDSTPTIEVVLDALARCPGHDWVVTLQPTSPLRRAEDIDAAIERCVEAGAPAAASVCLVEENPYWMLTVGNDGRMKPLMQSDGFIRRQDLPPVYVLNGAVYFARAEWLASQRRFITDETLAYIMPAERSHDIDTLSDFQQIEFQLGELQIA